MKPIIDKTLILHKLIDAFRYEESGAHFGLTYAMSRQRFSCS
jgi:hypothetical protein